MGEEKCAREPFQGALVAFGRGRVHPPVHAVFIGQQNVTEFVSERQAASTRAQRAVDEG